MIVLMVKCKICKHVFKIGESIIEHALVKHPRFFTNLLLMTSIGHKLISLTNKYMIYHKNGNNEVG
jgi:5'(3')-deoxyribonucleotidase